MASSEAVIQTTDGARYLRRLCKHWAHKFDVRYDEQQGHIPFDAESSATLTATDTTLQLRASHTDETRLARLQEVIVDHLQRSAGDTPLDVVWVPAD